MNTPDKTKQSRMYIYESIYSIIENREIISQYPVNHVYEQSCQEIYGTWI